MNDTVPDNVKKRRLQELVDAFYSLAKVKNQKLIGSEQLVLVESVSVTWHSMKITQLHQLSHCVSYDLKTTYDPLYRLVNDQLMI